MIDLQGARTEHTLTEMLYELLSLTSQAKFPLYEQVRSQLQMLCDDRIFYEQVEDPNFSIFDWLSMEFAVYTSLPNPKLYLEMHALKKAEIAGFRKDLVEFLQQQQSSDSEQATQLVLFNHYLKDEMIPQISGITWVTAAPSNRAPEELWAVIDDSHPANLHWADQALEWVESYAQRVSLDSEGLQSLKQKTQSIVNRLAITFQTFELLDVFRLLIHHLQIRGLGDDELIPWKLEAARWMLIVGEFAEANNIMKELIPRFNDVPPTDESVVTAVLEIQLISALDPSVEFDGFDWLQAWQAQNRDDGLMKDKRSDHLPVCERLLLHHAGEYKAWMRKAFVNLAGEFYLHLQLSIYLERLLGSREWRAFSWKKRKLMITYHSVRARHRSSSSRSDRLIFARNQASEDFFESWQHEMPTLQQVNTMVDNLSVPPFEYMVSSHFTVAIYKLLQNPLFRARYSEGDLLELLIKIIRLSLSEDFFPGEEYFNQNVFEEALHRTEQVFGKHDVRWFRMLVSWENPSIWLDDYLPFYEYRKQMMDQVIQLRNSDPHARFEIYQIAFEEYVEQDDMASVERILFEWAELADELYGVGTAANIEQRSKIARYAVRVKLYITGWTISFETIERMLADEQANPVTTLATSWEIWCQKGIQLSTKPSKQEVELVTITCEFIIRHWLKQPMVDDEESIDLTYFMFKWAIKQSTPEVVPLTSELYENLLERASFQGVSPLIDQWYYWQVEHGNEQNLLRDLEAPLKNIINSYRLNFSDSKLKNALKGLKKIDNRLWLSQKSPLRVKLKELYADGMSHLGTQHPDYAVW